MQKLPTVLQMCIGILFILNYVNIPKPHNAWVVMLLPKWDVSKSYLTDTFWDHSIIMSCIHLVLKKKEKISALRQKSNPSVHFKELTNRVILFKTGTSLLWGEFFFKVWKNNSSDDIRVISARARVAQILAQMPELQQKRWCFKEVDIHHAGSICCHLVA